MDIKVDVLAMGRARNYDTAVAFYSINMLQCLYAGGYLYRIPRSLVNLFSRFIPVSKLQRFKLRSSQIPDSFCRSIWVHLLKSLFIRDKDNRNFILWEKFSCIAGYLSNADVILAEQTEALEAFTLASSRGAKKALMMTGQSPLGRNEWLSQEYLNWPPEMPINFGCKNTKRLVERELLEIEQADMVLSPSEFVTNSLTRYEQFRSKRIMQINWPIFNRDFIISQPRNYIHDPIRILYVGGLNLGKGVMYLVKALEGMPIHTFDAIFIGGNQLSQGLTDRCCKVAKLLGHIPYDKLRVHYEWADIFVLPSLSEGRARVVIEAMAAGLPVIVTPNTGAPVHDHQNGIIVIPRDVSGIQQAINELSSNPELYSQLSIQALQTAKSLTVERYARELQNAIQLL